jgi:hypothetical protein
MLRRGLALAAVAAIAVPAAAATASQDTARQDSVRRDTAAPRAVPLEAPTPSWYTPDLHARVLAAGTAGVAVPEGATLPNGHAIPTGGGLAFTGIRPGAWMISPAGCTMNFVFGGPSSTTSGTRVKTSNKPRSSSTYDYYIGTAGHCTEKVGDEVVLITVGPTSPSPVLVHIGNTVKTTGDGGVGNDFALVGVKRELNAWVSPAMAHWGGPTGAYTGTTPLPMVHSGHGLVIGTGGTGRAAQGLYITNDTVYWAGATIFGDSGSAINTATGLAQANITHLVVDLKYPGANSAGTHISKILQLAGKPLATCSLAVPWPLPGCP